jgi:hypothetical protein
MDAEFFCLPEDMDVVGQLVRNLGRFVDPVIALKVMNAGAMDLSEAAQVANRYAGLLHGSIPPEREIDIEVNATLRLFGSRVYLRLWWPMLVEGYYYYPGLSEPVEGPHRTRDYRYFDQLHGLGLFLPALAIRDRMVLVPKGQNEALESTGTNDPAPPPLQRGVIEVDFRNPAEVEQAFVTIGSELRRELRQELLAYQSFRLADEADFDVASAHLGVPPSLLQHAIREESVARELIYNQLRCTAEPATVVKGVQTRVSLRIDNPSEIDLGQLRVQVRGAMSGMEINPQRVSIRLPAQSSVRADFSMVVKRPGDFVLEVLFLDPVAEAARDMLPMQQLWITSVASE